MSVRTTPYSILPDPPAGLVRLTGERGTSVEGRPAIGAAKPGARRNKESIEWVGSIMLDADLADFVLMEHTEERDARILGESVADRPPSERVVGARKAVKRDLHRRNAVVQTSADTLIDALRVRVADALGRLGVPVTHEVGSGWGLHLHIWLDEPARGTADHDRLCDQLRAVVDAARAEYGYDILDPAAALGGIQLAREIGSINTNAPLAERVVTRLGGDPDARWSWRTWTPPAAVGDDTAETRRRASRIVTAVTGVSKADRDRAIRERDRLRAFRKAAGTSQPRIDPTTHTTGRGRRQGTLADLGSSLGVGSRMPVKCPRHDDKSPSATLWIGQDGDLLLTCHSACRMTWLVDVEPDTEERPVYRRDALDAATTAVARALDAAASLPKPAESPESTDPPAYTAPTLEEMARRAALAHGLFESMGDRGINELIADTKAPKPRTHRAKPSERPEGGDLSPAYRAGLRDVVPARQSGRYVASDAIRDAGDAKVVLLRGTTGSGKTSAIRGLIDSMSSRARTWAICDKRSLVHSAVARLDLDAGHIDPDGKVRITQDKVERSLGICVDSTRHAVGRLGRDAKIDLLVVDESEAVLPSCAKSGTMTNRQTMETHSAMRRLVRRHADRIILADANLSDASVDALARMLGVDVSELLANAVLVEDSRPRHELSPMAALCLEKAADTVIAARELARAGRPFWFFAGSKAEADALHRELSEMRPDRVWARVTSAHDDIEGEALLRDPAEWVLANRGCIGGVIATPAIESGLSVAVELATPAEEARALGGVGGDIVIMSGARHQTWRRLTQMMSRARYASMILYCVPAHGWGPRWTSEAEILRAAEEGWEDTSLPIQRIPLSTPWAKSHRYELPDRCHAAAWAHAEMVEATARESVGLDFTRWLRAEGHPLTVASSKSAELEATRQEIVDAREAAELAIADRKVELAAAEIDAILAADPDALTLAEAHAVLDGGDPAMRPTAARVVLGDFYGPDKLDRDALTFDRHRDQGRSAVVRWADVVAWGRGEIGAMLEADAVETAVMAGKAAHIRRAAVTAATLAVFGIGADIIEGRVTGERVVFKRRGDVIDIEAVEVDTEDGEGGEVSVRRFDSLACWIADRRVRDALRLHCKIDPWSYLPADDRDWLDHDTLQAEIADYHDARKAKRDAALRAVPTPCDLYSNEGGWGQDEEGVEEEAEKLPWKAPKGHRLAQLIQAVAARIGVSVTSHRVRNEAGDRVRRILVDTASARTIARLGARHLHRVHGVVTAPVVEAMVEEQIEAERVLHREVCYERATVEDLDALKARHAAALDLASRRAAVAHDPTNADTHQRDAVLRAVRWGEYSAERRSRQPSRAAPHLVSPARIGLPTTGPRRLRGRTGPTRGSVR